MHLRNNRTKFQRLLLIQKGFLRFSRHTHNFSGKNRPNTGILNTRMVRRYYSDITRRPNDHEKKFDVLRKLENAGYRESERTSKFFQNKMKWLGQEIDENGIKPNKEKVKDTLDLKHPESPKQLKSFLGALQFLAKTFTKTVRTNRQITKFFLNTEWKGETEQQNDFETIKKMLAEIPALAHYAKDKDNIVTTDQTKPLSE